MAGVRSGKTVTTTNASTGATTTTHYKYTTLSGKLTRLEYNDREIDFIYDEDGRPYAMVYESSTKPKCVYYYILNAQGDVVALMNETGSVVADYTYDEWGKLISVTGSNTAMGNINPLRYRGYIYDSDTGLYYLQTRYYDPAIGRFINADTFATTDIDGLLSTNMFAYCENNPVMGVDPTGEWGHIVIGAIVGALVGGAGQVVSDIVTSVTNRKLTFSNWQTYAGAIAGGVAGGASLAATGNVGLANAAAGFATTAVGLSLEKITGASDKSWAEIGVNAVSDGAISYGLGKLPGIKGITRGRNSMAAVYKSGLTKFRNGTAARMSLKVIKKGIKSSFVSGLAMDGYYGLKQHGYDRTMRLFVR